MLYDGITQEIRKITIPRILGTAPISQLSDTYGAPCTTRYDRITGSEFIERIKIEAFGVVDVRTPDEFGLDHLPMAVNIPLSRLGESLEGLPGDETVYVVCQSGHRAIAAAHLLREVLPWRRFVVVEGGMEKIQADVDPIG